MVVVGALWQGGGWSDVAIPLIAPWVRPMPGRLCWSTRTGRWSAESRDGKNNARNWKGSFISSPKGVQREGTRARRWINRAGA